MDCLKRTPLKNYIILCVVLIGSIMLSIYFYMWYSTYEKEKYNSSVVTEYLNVIHYNELNDYLMENKDAVIYFSIFGGKEVYNFDKKFKRIINKNSLNGDILYLNVTDELNNKKLSSEINNNYCNEMPCIIVFEDGNVKSTFSIKNSNYDISLLEDFLLNEGVISD